MANFDQRGQHVENQINAESVEIVNFGATQNKADLAVELRKLLSEINRATQANKIRDDIALNVESHIKKAVIEIEKPQPKKKSILQHIEGAKSLLDGIASASGLVTALIQAAKAVEEFFR